VTTTTSDASPLRVTWLGHSTVLLELDGVRLVTDPLLRGRIGHVRRVAAAADGTLLRGLDAVLISHLHYDHLDAPSLRRLGRSVRVIVPVGGAGLLRRRGFRRVTEVDVGDEVDVGGLVVRATYAEHDGRRAPLLARTPALGYLIAGSARAYFAGDTDLFDGMSALATGLDVALVPVAGWGPRLPPGHLDPWLAAQALLLLRPRVAVPIHWGTYRRIGLPAAPALLRTPAETFARLAHDLAPGVDVRVLSVGERLDVAAAADAVESSGMRATGARP
jgi:L-ascorbate metabolism protein UlaG (beta-lactamase superfamily)